MRMEITEFIHSLEVLLGVLLGVLLFGFEVERFRGLGVEGFRGLEVERFRG
jgi:hypothetical protein